MTITTMGKLNLILVILLIAGTIYVGYEINKEAERIIENNKLNQLNYLSK